MSTSRIPELIDALVSQATTALEDEPVLVVDGLGVSEDPGDFLMIGVEEPTIVTAAFAASAGQEAGPIGSTRPRDETGSVTCAAYSWNGDANQKSARDAVFSYMGAVETFLRADPSLGITSGPLFRADLGDSVRLSQNQDTNGADALLIFTVRFFARL